MNDKKSKITITQFKNRLEDLSKQEIIELLIESFKISKEVQGYICAKLNGTDGMLEILEDYKKKIKTEFFPARGHGKLRVSVVKKAISDFKKIVKETNLTIELMIFFVENAVKYIHEYGDIFENMGDYLCNVFESIIKLLNKEKNSDLFMKYNDRLETIINTKGIDCWGIHDSLEDSYSDLKWLEYEEDDETVETAEEKWLKISEINRNKILENVWCGRCNDAVTIVDYIVSDDKYGVILKGKCKVCGNDVVRVVELEN